MEMTRYITTMRGLALQKQKTEKLLSGRQDFERDTFAHMEKQ